MALDPIGVIFTAKDLASGSVGRLDKKFKTLSNTTDDTALKFSKNLKLMGAGLAAVAVGAIGLGVLNVAGRKFASLGQSVAEVGTLIEGTPEEIKELTDQSIALANTFGGDAKAQAAAFYQAISAGVGGVSEAQEFLTIANKVAIGGVTDAATAIDGLTTITNAFIQDNVTAQQAADGLFVAMKAGKTTIGELSSGISKASTGAAALGIQFDELLGATSALTAGGVPTAEAFTSLKAVFTAFASKQETAKQLGTETAAAFSLQNLKAKGLRKTLIEVSKSVGGNIEDLTKLLGSSEAVNAVLALTGSQADKFAGIMEGMAKKTGEAEGAFLKMTQTTAFVEKRFDALSDGLVLTIGKAFDPIRKAILEFGVTVLEVFNSIPQPITDFIVKALALVFAIIAVGGAVVAMKAGFILLSIVAVKIGAVLLPIIGIVLGIAAAIGLLILLVKSNFGGIGDFFSETFNRIKIFFQAIIGVIKDGKISEELFNQLQDAGILGFVESVLGAFFKVKAFLTGLFEGFVGAFSATVEPVFEQFVNAFSDVLTVIGQIFGGVFSILNKLMGGTGDFAGALGAAEGAGLGIGATLGVVFGGLIDIMLFVITIVLRIVEGFLEVGRIITLVFGTAAEIIGGFVTFLSKVFTSPIEAVKGLIQSLKNAFTDLFKGLFENKIIKFGLEKLGFTEPGDETDSGIVPVAPKDKTNLGISSIVPTDETTPDIVPIAPVGPGVAGAVGINGEEAGITNAATALSSQNKSADRNAANLAGVFGQQAAEGEQQINLTTRVMIDENQIGEATERFMTKKRTSNGSTN